MKKMFAILMSLAMLVSFASCGADDNTTPDTTEPSKNISVDQTLPDGSPDITAVAGDVSTDSSENTSDVSETVTLPDDPSQWTKEEIIEFYKKAADKSNPNAKSKQVMVLTEFIVNDGDGALGFFLKILEPAIASVIEKNELEFDGITGGFGALVPSDAKSVKAYKSGNYTVIEMTMHNQTDGIHANEYEGSVGHAITVLGDISRVLAEFPQFDVDVENADIKINYINATLKVKINQNGIIEKGTWKYTCDPEIEHLKISGIMIDKADAQIDYIITVGGGF